MKLETNSETASEYEGGDANQLAKDNDSDIDEFDFNNFKGIYIDEDPNRKYQDPETGCHFEYHDLVKRLGKLKILRKKLDEQLGLPPAPDTPDERSVMLKGGRKQHVKIQSLGSNYLVQPSGGVGDKRVKSTRKSSHGPNIATVDVGKQQSFDRRGD